MPTSYCQNPSLVKKTKLISYCQESSTRDSRFKQVLSRRVPHYTDKSSITGKGSFREIATSLNQSLPGMSKQACAKRFSPKFTAFLQGVLSS